ncbi:MAG: Type III secretion lipoprotein SctJ [uncultured bacterium]|nr:MAG: Type III secretion lipoprotein SctJ [uncultured bacterium]
MMKKVFRRIDLLQNLSYARGLILGSVLLLIMGGCTSDSAIVNNIDEKEANEIVVFLASKGIPAMKVQATVSGAAAAGTSVAMYNIQVAEDQSTEAMALLNQYGLPRRYGTNLLTLFAKGGLVSSDREEEIRYQAGLAEELQNTILKMDGVLDADVQISFPPTESLSPGETKPKITAAVYVKHQGIMDDPNSHMEVKIKRLMAGSVNGLKFEDVTVISDRAILADIQLTPGKELIGAKSMQQTYVKIWGVTLTKGSLARFRFIFFALILIILLILGLVGWVVYKFYPLMRMKKKEGLESEIPPPPGS